MAAAEARRRGLITNRCCRKLAHLDIAAAWARHASGQRATAFLGELKAELATAQQAEAPAAAQAQEQPSHIARDCGTELKACYVDYDKKKHRYTPCSNRSCCPEESSLPSDECELNVKSSHTALGTDTERQLATCNSHRHAAAGLGRLP